MLPSLLNLISADTEAAKGFYPEVRGLWLSGISITMQHSYLSPITSTFPYNPKARGISKLLRSDFTSNKNIGMT
jgi:hypothetical protein